MIKNYVKIKELGEGGRADQSLMAQVCPMLLSAGREPNLELENNTKSAYQSRSAQLLTAQALRPESEPGRL